MPLIDRTTIWQGSSAPAALLTVIYPVFDVRGNAVERIGLWTERQDLEPHLYRVVVVADSGTDVED